MSYVLENYKFGAGGYGVSGGTVTYSFATSNFANEAYTYNSFLTGQYQTEVRAALAAWEAVANIHFVEVTDSTASDLRFGFVNNFAAKPWSAFEAGGAGGRAGQASVFYDNSPIHHVTDADIAFDGREGWQVVNGEILTGPGGTRFFSIALHEIGHVLGIDHDETANERSIMRSSLDPSYRGLEAVDIQAAQFIYGAAAAPVAGSISIGDVSIVEGNSGTKEAIFTITRAAGSGTAAFDVTYCDRKRRRHDRRRRLCQPDQHPALQRGPAHPDGENPHQRRHQVRRQRELLRQPLQCHQRRDHHPAQAAGNITQRRCRAGRRLDLDRRRQPSSKATAAPRRRSSRSAARPAAARRRST